MLSNHPNCLGGNGPSASSDLIGDVDGPASATDNAVARFDGTTGKLIQNSTVTIDDTGAIAGASSLTSPAANNLTLGLGTGGTALTLTSSTLAATFAGAVTAAELALVPASNSPFTNSAWIKNTANAGVFFVNSTISQYAGLKTDGTFITSGALSSGNAAFAGAVTIASTTAGSASAGALVVTGGLSAGNNGNASYFGGAVTAAVVTSTGAGYTNSGFQITNTSASRTTGLFLSNAGVTSIRDVTGAADLFTLSLTGAATFAGAVAIGNTVGVGVAVASTHKVTMVIGGVTYYLLASNV